MDEKRIIPASVFGAHNAAWVRQSVRFVCPSCKDKFPSNGQLKLHKRQVHRKWS